MSIALRIGDTVHAVTIVRRHPRLVLSIDGRHHEIGASTAEPGELQTITVDGRMHGFRRASGGGRQFLRMGGETFEVTRVDLSAESQSSGASQDIVRAPMPGAVIEVHRRPGDAVKRGETIVTIESMKLQTALAAARDGVVAEIRRAEGETFEKDEIIATLEPETEA